MNLTSHQLKLLAAFLALYLIWGSTYFAIHIAVTSWPPFLMAGVRFVLAGTLMYGFLRWRGAANPTLAELKGATLLGILMPAIGNGFVTLAQKEVSSGVAALVVATVPLFAILFARLFGHIPRRMELAGVLLGIVGIVVLNMGSNLQASPAGAAALLFASAGWALGSAWSKHLTQPKGLMSSAMMMLTGGIALLYLASFVLGFFDINVPVIHEASWLGIAFSLFVVVVAALNLVLDFDFIETGVEQGAPKYMEWYGAFGLMVTLVWLYLELLRLLSKLQSRD